MHNCHTEYCNVYVAAETGMSTMLFTEAIVIIPDIFCSLFRMQQRDNFG